MLWDLDDKGFPAIDTAKSLGHVRKAIWLTVCRHHVADTTDTTDLGPTSLWFGLLSALIATKFTKQAGFRKALLSLSVLIAGYSRINDTLF
mmetsp:Transcript_12788/g.21920  ORF Transcript_12788/g.21920 Transcript_12788/m.21920 type:complete len:91 (+) Transcript_12788:1066-1338(+)